MTRKKKLQAAKNYALYYGFGREQDLAQFDLAIVEPLGQSQAAIKCMQEKGTLVCAYLSVMELSFAADEMQLLTEEDLLKGPGGPLKNEQYGNWLVDLRSKKWQRMLGQKAENLFTAGYDGLFLDTLADVEYVPVSADCRTELIFAAAALMGDLKKDYPGHLLIQNNGMERLCLMTAKLIDALCWENPPLERPESAAWSKEVIKRLKRLRDEEKLSILLLMQQQQEAKVSKRRWKACEAAQRYGFLFYEAPPEYTAGVNMLGNIKSP